MIKIKNYIFNENEIVKIQFDDGSKEIEIDHKNGNRTFIDGTFDDIEWNYDKNNNIHEEYVISQLKDYENKIKDLEKENKKLNELVQFNVETTTTLTKRINKAISYINSKRYLFTQSSQTELIKILMGEENDN